MAKVKNSFLKSKMNKDLDNRLIPNGEYRNALNITVNNSDGEDVGTAQTVRGNLQVIDFNTITGQASLQVVGVFDDEFSNTVFAFVTNNTISTYNTASYSAIVSWNVDEATTSAKIIIEGNWLNFSTLSPVVANLLEDLLFFTDNKNQPRKVNINYQAGYYTTEDQISVAKYYPYQTIEFYQGSQVSGAQVLSTTATEAATSSTTVVCASVAGLSVGDVLISGGDGVSYNTFVVNIDIPTLTVTLSQSITVAISQVLIFSSPETSMRDAISLYLPPTGEGTVPVIPASATEFSLTDYKGYISAVGSTPNAIGFNVYIRNISGNFIDTGAKVIAVNKDTANAGLAIETDVASGVVITDEVLLAIPNPYYDFNFAQTANVDYLEDKFPRFSYRFLFDDGEYSLIAPFTQPCFIPKQDGYFLTPFSLSSSDVDISDEKKAYQSTEVTFMQNKVNQINLNVPLPYTQGTIQSTLKIKEIDILYKESNAIAIKVVDSIPVEGNFSGDDFYFQYEYGSKSPYKTLPESENTRVYDKVPVRAQSQEIISNRVVYANYQDKHTPPNFLDYNTAATEKFNFGTSIAGKGTSKIEYPNANLKQNRNYEVGIVLADRFGRQSTVILSESELNNLPSYLASTIYNKFRNASDQLINPEGFDGDSLKVTFNNLIPSNYLGSPGLYNGTQASSSYNPLGWYSFKVVVKQLEQDYYNAYVAPIMKAYPDNSEKEIFETSHISLFGDNINKVPRDLNELGPTQKQFRSSVKLWPRVTCDTTNANPFFKNSQFFPERIGDIASAIGTVDDLFDLPSDPGSYLGTLNVVDVTTDTTNTIKLQNVNFYPAGQQAAITALLQGLKVGDEIRGVNYGTKDTNITSIQSDLTPPISPTLEVEITLSNAPQGTINANNINIHRHGGRVYFYNQQSDPLIAKISTSKQAGVLIPESYPDQGGALNIYEVEAQESLLDIFWETSTTGLISELNTAIAAGPGALIYEGVDGWNPILTEATNTSDPLSGIVVSGFRPEMSDGASITPANLTTATILSVYERGNPANTTNRAGNSYMSRFNIVDLGNGSFNLVVIDDSELVFDTGNNDLTFQIVFDHPNAVSSLTELLDVDLVNVDPTIDNGTCPVIPTIESKTNTIYDFTGENGSFTNSLDKLDLTWSLTGATDTLKFEIGNVISANPLLNTWGQLRATSLQTQSGPYTIQVTLTDGGGATDVCDLSVTYSYAPTAIFSDNISTVNLNNSVADGFPGGGNVSLTNDSAINPELVISNGDFGVKLRYAHNGSTANSWTTTFNGSFTNSSSGTVYSFSRGYPTPTSPVTSNDSPSTTLPPGTYTWTLTVTSNGLPALSSGIAQSLGSWITTYIP